MAIPVNGKLKPRNDADFALIDAQHIEYEGGRLPDFLPLCVTQEEYDRLKRLGQLNDNTPYLIIEKVEQ